MSSRAKRLPDSVDGEFPEGFDDSAISFWRDLRLVENPPAGGSNGWIIYLPGGGVGNLSRHQIAEHEDGTITVSPSILMTSTRPNERRRHGFLKRGVWEPCGDDIAPPEPPRP